MMKVMGILCMLLGVAALSLEFNRLRWCSIYRNPFFLTSPVRLCIIYLLQGNRRNRLKRIQDRRPLQRQSMRVYHYK